MCGALSATLVSWKGPFLVALDAVGGVKHNALHLGRVVNELTELGALDVTHNIRSCLKTLTTEDVAGVDVLNIRCHLHTQVLKHGIGEQVCLCYQLCVDLFLDGIDLCNTKCVCHRVFVLKGE